MDTTAPFNPQTGLGITWLVNGQPYREICRNNVADPMVCVVAEVWWENIKQGTTRDIPLSELRASTYSPS